MQVLGSLHWAGVEQFLTLPLSDLFEGRIVQVEGVLYTYNSGAWRSPPGILPGIDVTTTGFFLSNDGVNAVWQASPSGVPPVDGTTIGKYLTNDGIDSMWDVVLRSGIEFTGPSQVLINSPTGAMSSEVYLNAMRGGLGVDASAFTGILRATAGVFTAGTVANADLDPGIDAVKIADGTVTNAEFQFINTLSSNAQTQLDARLLLAGGTLTGPLLLAADPLTALGAATKQYVDSVGAGLEPKSAARAATTADITLSGAQTIDGVSVIAGNRVLVKDQTLQENNGLYLCAAGAWTRTTDMDSWLEVPGAYVFIQEGTLNIGSSWVCSSPVGGNMGVTAITWVQFSGGANITTDGQGIEITGSQLSLELDGTTLSKTGTGLKVAALGITNAEISASAGIVDTKLATIATAGKVSNSATTATDLNTASAIVARDVSGNFAINDITGFDGTAREFSVVGSLFDLASTGAISFAGFTVTGGNTTFTVGAGTGQIFDHLTNGYFPVSWGAFVGQVPAIATGITYVYITRTNSLSLSATLQTANDRRDMVYLGKIGAIAGTITGSTTNLITSVAVNADLFDLGVSISTFKVDNGLIPTFNGANLFINRSAGYIFELGINFVVDQNNPNIKLISAATAPTLIRATSDTVVDMNTSVNPGFYDLAGTVTPIPGAPTRASIKRFYQFTGSTGNIAMQYGQAHYATLTEAIQNISLESFTINSNIPGNAILIGVLCVTSGCTNLSDTATARFFTSGKFGEIGTGASGTSVSSMQNTYNNSTVPQILTDAIRDGVTIRRGSAADTDVIFRGQNGAGTETASLTGAGVFTAASFPSPLIPDFIRFTETTTPATPSAGTLAVYAKIDHKLYKKDSNGIESLIGSGSSSGVKNYISNPNDATNWTSSNQAQLTVATESNTTLIPNNITQTNGIIITRISGAAYVYTRWTVDASDYNWNCALLWAQKYAGTAGDYTVSLWTNTQSNYGGSYVQVPLPTSSIPAATTNFGPIAGLSGGSTTQWMELRITGVAGTTPLYLNGVTYTPNPPSQGAAVGNSIQFTPVPVFTGGTTYTLVSHECSFTRMGEQMLLDISISSITTGTTTPTQVDVTLPYKSGTTPYTVGGITNQRFYGDAEAFGLLTNRFDASCQAVQGATVVTLTPFASNTFGALGAGKSLRMTILIPIAEWAGSGLNMGAGAQVEYASNSGAGGTAANTDYTTGSVVGASQFVAVNSADATNAWNTRYAVTFQYPIQNINDIDIEVSETTANQFFSKSRQLTFGRLIQKTAVYGMWIEPRDSTSVWVVFGNAGRFSDNPTYGGTGAGWSGIAGSATYTWRLRKANPSSPVGFGLAGVDGSAGLYMAGRAPGSVSGAAIAAGMIGENYTDVSTTFFTTSPVSILNRTLQPGVWRIAAYTYADTGLGPIGAKVSISTVNNTHDSTNQAWIPSSGGILSVNTECFVNISVATTYYLVGQVFTAAVTNAQRTRLICQRFA